MATNKVVVAVITRTKDRPLFLERAIKSVGSQTFKNFVHVIINDGGRKEDVENIVHKFDESIKCRIKTFHRIDASNAPDTIFNESIDRVDSKYFAIHDDDDTWHPDFLKASVEHLQKNTDLGAVVLRADKVIESVSGHSILERRRRQLMPELKAINLYRQCIDNQLTPIATLFSREAYEKTGKFDSTLPVVGDWEFGLRLLMKYDVDYLDPGFALANYHHRMSADNSFSKNSHRFYTNQIMNRYLREELAKGKLGVGYIMSKERYQQNYISRITHKVMPGFVASRLKRRAEQ